MIQRTGVLFFAVWVVCSVLLAGTATAQNEATTRAFEADTEASPEADTEASPEADTEASPEADTEASPEADTEASPEADTEAESTTAADDQNLQGSEGCASPQPIETFSGSENQRTAPFEVTGESFRIRFETEPAGQDPFLPTVEVDVLNENGRPIGEGFLAFEGEDGAENILAGPDTFRLEIRADEASYEVTVDDCGGAADDSNGNNGNGDQGDVDDPGDVVGGPGDGKPLPHTGGAPLLLGAVALALASALLARRVLAP